MKLNLRDLFWLIFVAAVATMWWIDRARLATELAIYKLPPPDPVEFPAPVPAPYGPDDPFGAPAVTPPIPAPAPAELDPFG